MRRRLFMIAFVVILIGWLPFAPWLQNWDQANSSYLAGGIAGHVIGSVVLAAIFAWLFDKLLRLFGRTA